MSRHTVDRILKAVRGCPEFETWRKDPAANREALDAFLFPLGLTVESWPKWCHWYESCVELAKPLADFTVTYGFPPATDATTIFLLSLITPYARHIRETPEPVSPEAEVISRLHRMMFP
jgi:hypothetical protein